MCLYQITATQSQHGVIDCTEHVYIVHERRNILFFLTEVQVCCKCEEAEFLQILCFIMPPFASHCTCKVLGASAYSEALSGILTMTVLCM